MDKIQLTDDTIDNYIENTINSLPIEIKKQVSDDYNELIDAKAQSTASFIDCVNIYFLGACLLEAISKLNDITANKELYLKILAEINEYLYKKQYESESKFLKYIPDSKAWINQTLGLIDKGGVLQKDESNNPKDESLGLEQNIPFKRDETPNLYIPKLEKEVLTTPSLLKTTGLMNPEIAKLVNDGKFTNLTSFNLTTYSLHNQFVIRHRESQYIDPDEKGYKNISFYEINKDTTAQTLNKYYLFQFDIKNNGEKQEIKNVVLFLNAISHVEFKPGYLDTLRKKLISVDRKERYIFTFGILSSFKWELEFIGQKHRCALIYDTKDSKIYYIDSYMNEYTHLLLFNNVSLILSSINTVLCYKLANVNINELKKYTVNSTTMRIQEYDLVLKDYIRQSVYQRRKAGSKQFDWTAGYCGTYILLFLVIMILNPTLDIQTVIDFFVVISDSKQSIHTNHEFLRLLIRSFALQIENYIYGKSKQIDIDYLDMTKYIISNGKTIATNTMQYTLTMDNPDYYANPMNNPLLKRQMFHINNIKKITGALQMTRLLVLRDLI